MSSLLTGNNYFICNCSIKIALRAKVKLVSLMACPNDDSLEYVQDVQWVRVDCTMTSWI